MSENQREHSSEEQPRTTDLIDGILDISEAISEVAHPLEGIVNSLVAEVESPSSARRNEQRGTFRGGTAHRSNSASTGDFDSPDPFLLYKTILQTAFTYERAYITCSHAAAKAGFLPVHNERSANASPPPPNLIVLPCLASIPTQVWLAALAEVPNIDIFLPPSSCDACSSNIEGFAEKTYIKAISTAEAAAGRGPGLTGEAKEILTCHHRALKREHFAESASRLPESLLEGKAPQSFEEQAAERAEAVMAKLRAFMHTAQQKRSLATPPNEFPEDFNKAGAGSKKLIRPARLTKEQTLLLATLHTHSSIAQNLTLAYPVRNQALCTYCGACQKACPTQAIQVRRDNSFQVIREACITNGGCNACERACPVHALHYETLDAKNYVEMPTPPSDKT